MYYDLCYKILAIRFTCSELIYGRQLKLETILRLVLIIFLTLRYYDFIYNIGTIQQIYEIFTIK